MLDSTMFSSDTSSILTAQDTADICARVRRSVPLIQCLTNTVVQGLSANVLLAAGASPAMCDIVGEAGAFAQFASGTLINIGTPNSSQREAMREAASAAQVHNTPWVLDPVAIGALPVRTNLAAALLSMKPTVIRGNASEVIALHRTTGADVKGGGRGTDATDSAEAALPSAHALAAFTGGIVAISGPVDIITDGHTDIHCANGVEMLTTVTGGGCALGGYITAFVSCALTPEDDPTNESLLRRKRLQAVGAAHVCYGIAAELALAEAGGPGTFAALLLDKIFNLDEKTILERTSLS